MKQSYLLLAKVITFSVINMFLQIDYQRIILSTRFRCPQLILSYYYNSKGRMGLVDIDGQGLATLTLNDYVIASTGKYGQFLSDKDDKLHFYHISHKTEFEPKGTVVVNLIGSTHSDKTKDDVAKKFIKENPSVLENIIRSPIMESYVAQVMNTFDTFLRYVPADDVLSAEYA